MKKSFLLFFVFISCVQVPSRPPSLVDQVMQIDAVIPQEASALSQHSRMAILFSQPVESSTVTDQSVLLIHGDIDTQTDYDVSTLYSNINRERIEKVPLQFSFSRNRKFLVLTPSDALVTGEPYTLVVTSRVLSQKRLPLFQEISRVPLKVTYQVMPEASAHTSLSSYPATDSVDQMIDQLMAEQNQETSSSNTSIPSTTSGPSPEEPGSSGASAIPPESGSGVVSSPERTNSSGGASGGGTGGTSVTPVSVGVHPIIVINEIFYDAVGSDTDGVVFVELHGTPRISLNHFKINFINGSDGVIYDSITLPENAQTNAQGFYVIADTRTGSPTLTQVAHADLVDNFDPQNGSDAVQLLDADNQLLDAVGYGEGVISQAANHLSTYEGSPAPDVVNGHSLERISPHHDTQNNATDFVDRPTPTPGE